MIYLNLVILDWTPAAQLNNNKRWLPIIDTCTMTNFIAGHKNNGLEKSIRDSAI
jgi:hypothetical protein